MQPLIIEVAINELASRDLNPHVPYSIDEVVADAIACARAGAAIVHLHARDAQTGEQRWFDTQFYRDAFAAIRAECDAVLYPTQPGSGMDRCPHVIELADEGLEMATVDVFSHHSNSFEGENPDPNIAVMRALRERGVSFSMGVREVGHLRKLQRYRELGLLDDHLHLKIFLDEELVGPTPDARGLLMFLDHLPPGQKCDWFTTLYRGRSDGLCFRRLCMLAAAMGGHIRTGLGDMPVLDGKGTYTNVDMVEMAADLARRAGREVATAAHARAILAN